MRRGYSRNAYSNLEKDQNIDTLVLFVIVRIVIVQYSLYKQLLM